MVRAKLDPVDEIPALVARAMELARDNQFENSCIPEVGRLLRNLSAGISGGVIGETGTGYGVGAAWIVTGLQPTSRFATVEIDPNRSAAVRQLLSDQPNVVVINGDWKELAHQGPFDMLFLDGGGKREDQDLAVSLLKPGGFAVMDDFTPKSHWPEEWRQPGWVDPVRSWWMSHPDLATTEILTSPSTAAMIAIRLPR